MMQTASNNLLNRIAPSPASTSHLLRPGRAAEGSSNFATALGEADLRHNPRASTQRPEKPSSEPGRARAETTEDKPANDARGANEAKPTNPDQAAAADASRDTTDSDPSPRAEAPDEAAAEGEENPTEPATDEKDAVADPVTTVVAEASRDNAAASAEATTQKASAAADAGSSPAATAKSSSTPTLAQPNEAQAASQQAAAALADAPQTQAKQATTSDSNNAATVDANATAASQANASSAETSTDAEGQERQPGSSSQPNASASAAKAANTQHAAAPPPTTGAPAVEAISATPTNGASSHQAPPPAPALPQASAQQAEADASTRVNEARLARGLTSLLNQKGGAVTLRLTPPDLGTVRVQLQMGGGNVSASFQAETPAARNLLQQQMSHLRTALEAQGLAVDRLSVQSGNGSSANQFNQQNNADGSPNEGRSRGQYAHDRPPSGQGDRERDASSRGFDQWIRETAGEEAFALATKE